MGKHNGFGDDGKRLSPESSSTRLYEEDYVEIKNLCVGGRKESEVIRELVRRALYARRYRQATNDPAFKELLRTFDDQIGLRIHHLEERLTRRMDADFVTLFNLIADVFIGANFMGQELGKVGLSLAPEEVPDEEFYAGFNERLKAMDEKGREILRKRLAARNQALADKGKAEGPDIK